MTMNKSISRIATSVAAAALCVGAAAGTAVATTSRGSPSPAGQLMTKVAPANGNGICAPISYTNTSFTGWCDGTGPQTYGTYVDCSDWLRYYSTYLHWYGDRRGVTSFCPAGTTRVAEGYLVT